ncbi:MAG: hypothetical protein N2690_00185 [Rhodocyclaceae bacterium]|nr:hypothetical protein [Rhodocyclaceae bacterium]
MKLLDQIRAVGVATALLLLGPWAWAQSAQAQQEIEAIRRALQQRSSQPFDRDRSQTAIEQYQQHRQGNKNGNKNDQRPDLLSATDIDATGALQGRDEMIDLLQQVRRTGDIACRNTYLGLLHVTVTHEVFFYPENGPARLLGTFETHEEALQFAAGEARRLTQTNVQPVAGVLLKAERQPCPECGIERTWFAGISIRYRTTPLPAEVEQTRMLAMQDRGVLALLYVRNPLNGRTVQQPIMLKLNLKPQEPEPFYYHRIQQPSSYVRPTILGFTNFVGFIFEPISPDMVVPYAQIQVGIGFASEEDMQADIRYARARETVLPQLNQRLEQQLGLGMGKTPQEALQAMCEARDPVRSAAPPGARSEFVMTSPDTSLQQLCEVRPQACNNTQERESRSRTHRQQAQQREQELEQQLQQMQQQPPKRRVQEQEEQARRQSCASGSLQPWLDYKKHQNYLMALDLEERAKKKFWQTRGAYLEGRKSRRCWLAIQFPADAQP